MSTPMFERIRHKAIAALVLGLVAPALWTTTASASINYFNVLNQEFGFVGNCSVCHSGALGSVNTATKPFAQTLKANGAVGKMDDDALRMILFALPADSDSDGDGADDLFELMNQGDPSDPSVLPGGFVPPLEETYGCLRVSRAPAGSDSLGVLSAGLLGLVLTSSLLRRRRRR